MRFIHRDNSVIRDFLMLPQEQITYELLFNEVCIFGDADYCARRLRELAQQVDLRHLILSFNYFTIEHEKCLQSMQRFVREVMPRAARVMVCRRASPAEPVVNDMRFGLFIMGTRRGSYQAVLEQVCQAEQLGFDTVDPRRAALRARGPAVPVAAQLRGGDRRAHQPHPHRHGGADPSAVRIRSTSPRTPRPWT